jgi:hypothetical protein
VKKDFTYADLATGQQRKPNIVVIMTDGRRRVGELCRRFGRHPSARQKSEVQPGKEDGSGPSHASSSFVFEQDVVKA